MNIRFASICIVSSLATVVHAGPLKVYVLVGQSNMQGHGNLRTVPYMTYDPDTRPLHDKMVAEDGTPRSYDDIRIVAYSEAGSQRSAREKQGPLSMGYGADLGRENVCGPELAFGITMRERLDEPILLIKTAWGGTSLNTDFRPPGAGRYKLPAATQALWNKHPNGAHGVPGKAEREVWWAKKDEATGHYYRLMIRHVKETLKKIADVHPAYDPEQGYELTGLVWFQGWNDMCDRGSYPDGDKPGGYAEYTELMAHVIRDVRKDLDAPELRVVIGVIGVDGDKAKGGIANLRPAMAAPAAMEEFAGTVAAVETGVFWDHRMAELATKRGAVEHRLQAGHVIGEDGLMEDREQGVPGWVAIGTPAPSERTWRFTSVAPAEADHLALKEKKRYREIGLPAELSGWHEPDFDDSAWQSGKAPIGKGIWKHRGFPEVAYASEWGDGEFLLMRTNVDVDNLDYEAFRISILARQGFAVYLNGQKVNTYIWWRDDPHYRAIPLENKHAALLREGINHLAVYAGTDYHRHSGAASGAVDVMVEGITAKDLAYVNSEENKLRLMDKVCTREEGRIIMGCSNGGYHYLGSAKMLSQIGRAFAEAMVHMQRD